MTLQMLATNYGLRLKMLIFIFDRFAVQVAAMTEKKTATKLTAKTDSGTETPDPKRCIICQKSTPEATTGTEIGRKRVHQAASIREDVVSKRLKVIGQEDFVYHMSNQCYKTYTMKSVLDRITKGKSAESQDVDNTTRSKRAVRRSSSMPRPEPTPECKIYKQTCVICGNVKHQGNYEKYEFPNHRGQKNFWKQLCLCRMKFSQEPVIYKIFMQRSGQTCIVINNV